jgi:proline iminopeptidase
MQTLYPPIKTYAQHTLIVEEPHQLYIEESGNPEGFPVLFVHGGPGLGSESYQRCFFDPEKYRIILFDQRGSGRSTPHGLLENNNTSALLDDIETIRIYLNIEQWVLFGTAFGGTLSLLYAQKYPEFVHGLILHGIFLARPQDIRWLYQQGANAIFPDYWEDFIHSIPLEERHDLITAYHERLTGSDELARMATAKNWSIWQARCRSFQLHNQMVEHFSDAHVALGLACIENHYLLQSCFLSDYSILEHMDIIKNIPGFIINGRYDMICPLQSAWELHKTWSASEIFIIRDAGHSLLEPAIVDAVILATQKMLQIPKKAC